jgi:sialic acid synthase SpsE
MRKNLRSHSKPYIIGETALNHEGDIEYLLRMVDEVAEVKLNAVKFHLLLNPASYMQVKHPLLHKTEKWIFKEAQWEKIINHANNKGLDVIALCDDVESVEFLLKKKIKIDSIELHAVSLNDYFLLNAVSEFRGRIILGIGGSSIDEIHYAIEYLQNRGRSNILLMYGFQSYPTDYSQINLSKMIKIKNLFNLPVGYADHTAFDDPNNVFISVMGAMMGFPILEKHFTPDYGKERIDYHAAVGKDQMKEIVKQMNLALQVYGTNSIAMSIPEKNYGNIGPMKKAIVARVDIKKGEKLSEKNLWFKRTREESPIAQNHFHRLIGLEAKRDIAKDEIIDYSDVNYHFRKMSEDDFTKVGKSS